MAQLPTVGGDNNQWGTILNTFLGVSLDGDGTMKKAGIEEALTGNITSHTHNTTPLTNQIYSGQFNLSTNYEVYYNQYTTNVAETPTIASTPLVGSIARCVFNTGASGSLVVTNLGTLRPGSDTYTISKLNEILVFSLPEGLEYSIKVLN
jgi:hypothetical protein